MKIGYTTGVYDMFHVGHLNVLETAKQYCDYLIVGVSTDSLVEKYKKKVPIVPFDDRCRIVSALTCVDKVVAQKSRDKIAQYEEIKYDVIFVGDDWKGSEIFTTLEKYLNNAGAQIMYLPYTSSVSSTKFKAILEQIWDEN